MLYTKINKINDNLNRRVFISYSHAAIGHEKKVEELSKRLRDDGVDAWIDLYEPSPSRGWALWMVDELEKADFVIIVVSLEYQQQLMMPKLSSGKGVTWEGLLITQELYDAHSQNKRFIPVLFSENDKPFIPIQLRPFSYFNLDSSNGYIDLYRYITQQLLHVPPKLGKELFLPPDMNIGPFRSDSERAVITSYSAEWLKHPIDITSVEDYYGWHESPEFWKSGPGEMFAISNREIEALWSMSRYSVIYEVWLKRFINAGGKASRIYVIADEYVSESTHNLFLSCVYRHFLLGFKPKIAYLPQTEKYRVECLKAQCDTYAVLNRKVCLLYQFPPNKYPMFVRSTHEDVVKGAIQAHDNLIHETIDFYKWYTNNHFGKLSKSQIKEIENEANRICEIAEFKIK